MQIDKFICDTLEPTIRKQEGKPVCIPSGTYQVKIRWSDKNKMMVPGLLGVPNRSDIEIHIGNAPKDTLGCILPGNHTQMDWVSNSKDTFSKLFPLIDQACKDGDVFINVIG